MLRDHGQRINLDNRCHLLGAELVWRSRYSSNNASDPSASTIVSITAQLLAWYVFTSPLGTIQIDILLIALTRRPHYGHLPKKLETDIPCSSCIIKWSLGQSYFDRCFPCKLPFFMRNLVLTFSSKIEFACMFFHISWSTLIQLILCLVLLIVNLGPSAWAGFCFFVFASPMQTLAMRRLLNLRRRAMVWTDKRAKLLQELLGGMRVIKYFGWEVSILSSVAVSSLTISQVPLIERISQYRKSEMKHIRSLLLLRAVNNAIAFALPALAAIVSFVVYAAIGHTLDPAVIFTALTLFQLLRLPLQLMRMSVSQSKARIIDLNAYSYGFERNSGCAKCHRTAL